MRQGYLFKADIFLAVISHKNVRMPSNPIYFPLEVGASKRNDHFFELRDNIGGDNISNKNQSYCELTGLYWIYKNVDYRILGLVHYRRYFMKNNFCLKKNLNNIISKTEIENILSKYDIILPKKRHYYIETNYSHYVHAHPKESIDKLREIITKDDPGYLESFDEVMTRRSGHYFNMFIAKKEVINPFLEWMFNLLFKVEKEIDISDYDDYNKRIFGFLSELLFDVYCTKNKLKIKDQKYLFFEKQNWIKKGFNFMRRKFNHGKNY